MPLLLRRSEVLAAYAQAAARGWVLPCFGTENLTTTEAILSAALERARELGEPALPITVAITHRYPERSQSSAYTLTDDPALGLRLFRADLQALVAPGSPFDALQVLAHLDHGQHDLDADALESPAGSFSSVMYDASTLPFEENIAATRRYVERHGADVVVEGACDSIAHAGESEATPGTAPDVAERYFRATGVDWVVANLGTEHRAGISRLRYRDDLAREITRRIGRRLCLHGASSLAPEALAGLFADGIGKVNLWTALERDASAELLRHLVVHAGAVAGTEVAGRLHAEGLLGPRADLSGPVSLDYCTTRHRQQVVFATMKRAVLIHLRRWYPK